MANERPVEQWSFDQAGRVVNVEPRESPFANCIRENSANRFTPLFGEPVAKLGDLRIMCCCLVECVDEIGEWSIDERTSQRFEVCEEVGAEVADSSGLREVGRGERVVEEVPSSRPTGIGTTLMSERLLKGCSPILDQTTNRGGSIDHTETPASLRTNRRTKRSSER